MVAFLEAVLWRQTAKASSFTGSTGPSKGSHWPDTIAHSGRFWKCKGPQCFSTLLISTGHRETTACEAPSIRFKEMETFKPENWQGRIVATCLNCLAIGRSMNPWLLGAKPIEMSSVSQRAQGLLRDGLSHLPQWRGLGVHLVWSHFPVLAAHLSGLADQAAGSGLQRSYAFPSSI